MAMNMGTYVERSICLWLARLLQLFSVDLIPDFYDQWRSALKYFARVWNVAYKIPEIALALKDVCPCCFVEGRDSVMLCVDGNFQHKRFWSRSTKAAVQNSLDNRKFLPIPIPSHRKRGREIIGYGLAVVPSLKLTCTREEPKFGGEWHHGCRLPSRHTIESHEHHTVWWKLLLPCGADEVCLSDSACPAKAVLAYDVACKFEAFAKKNLPTATLERLEFVVPAFHITTHGFNCHLDITQGTTRAQVWVMERVASVFGVRTGTS